ncbi:MAG: hypothetical protein EOO24_53240, partial [Comamonadaceae bacterium]
MQAAVRAPMGPWRSADSARPLVAWRDAQLRALAGALQHAITAWRSAWGLSVPATVRCSTQVAVEPGLSWRGLTSGSNAAGWCHVADGASASLGAALFEGCGLSGPMARELAQDCEEDAVKHLLAVLELTANATVSEAGPTQVDAAAWSGMVDASIAGPLPCRLLLPPTVMAAWLAANGGTSESAAPAVARAALTPVLQATAATQV